MPWETVIGHSFGWINARPSLLADKYSMNYINDGVDSIQLIFGCE